jgi:hypothetical protein
MSELTVEKVNSTVRLAMEANVKFVSEFLTGVGIDMGCGSCPLLTPPCKYYVDMSSQPLCVEQIEGLDAEFYQTDCTKFSLKDKVDFIFSSHMLEDLPSKEDILDCLEVWRYLLRFGGHIVLLLPDMQGGRHPRFEEGGNPSHRFNVGVPFIKELMLELPNYKLAQIDTIPHDMCDTFDVVLRRVG